MSSEDPMDSEVLISSKNMLSIAEKEKKSAEDSSLHEILLSTK